jgi:hypothetical protein
MVKMSVRLFLDICLFIAFIGILIAYLVQKYPIGPEKFSPGTITQVSPTSWNFVPTPGYYGNVTLSYQLTDGSTNPPVPDTATFQVQQTYAPVTLTSQSGTLAPDSSLIAPYTFKASDLLSILGATSPQNGQIGITNIVITAKNNIPTDPAPPNPIGTLTANGAVYNSTTVYQPSTSFVFTPNPSNGGNITVTLSFQVVDNYVGQTIAPGLTQIVQPTNASINFVLPYTYQPPTIIPVTLSGPYYQGTPFTLSSQQLIGSSTGDVRHPTLSVSNLAIQSITVSSNAIPNQVMQVNNPVLFNYSSTSGFLTYGNGYFTVNVTGTYNISYTVNITNYASATLSVYLIDNKSNIFMKNTWSPPSSSWTKIPGQYQSGGIGVANPGTGPSGCETGCDSTSGCVGFSYSSNGSDSACYPKSSLSSGFVSGPYDTYVGQYQNISGFASGNGLAIIPNPLPGSGAVGCNAICAGNPNCVGFSYSTNGTDNNCYLKNDISSLNGTGPYSTWTNTAVTTLSITENTQLTAGTTFSLQFSRACTVQSGSITFT